MKRGLLAAAIAGGLSVAPACGNAQEQLLVTITAGDDLGVGLAKTYENGGFLSMDLGGVRRDSVRSIERSSLYGDIGGGFRSGSFLIAGILGLAVGREDCTRRPPCVARPVYSGLGADKRPERWHPVGFRAGVGAIVFVRNVALGAKAIHGPHGGGRYSAWLGVIVDKDWLRKSLEDRRRAVSWPD